MFSLIQSFDTSAMYAVQDLRTPLLDALMVAVTTIGDSISLILITVLLLALGKNLRKIGLILAGGQAINLVIVTLLKNVVQRPRPFEGLNDLIALVEASSFSFPSGHASSIFVFAFVIICYAPKLSIPMSALACAVAFSRVYLGVHYPSDVIVGALIGSISGICAILIYKNIIAVKYKNLLSRLNVL